MGEARLKGGQPSPTGEGAKSPPLWFDWLTIKEGRVKEGSFLERIAVIASPELVEGRRGNTFEYKRSI